MEAASPAAAIRLEARLREIWSHNISIGRVRVHRGGSVVVVVWSDGVAPEVWQAVNAEVAARLIQP